MYRSLSPAIISVMLLFGFISCETDPDPKPNPDHAYQINILEPSIDFILYTDTLKLKIEFKDSMGGIIENVSVRFYSLIDSTVVYAKPDNSAVAADGMYVFEDFRLLNDLTPHTNWVLEAKAWGKNQNEFMVVKTKGIHVHG